MIDPTLLLGNYEGFVYGKSVERTLVCYPLGDDSELQNFSKQLARRLNLVYIDNFNKRTVFKKVVWNRNSIEEWITNIANADFVVTRSFHGMLFSIIFNKNFVVLSGKKKRNTRLTDFLGEVGLMGRYFTTIDEIEKSKVWLHKIDYTKINIKVTEMRTASLKALKSMING